MFDFSLIGEYCLCDQWLPLQFTEHNFYYQMKQDNQEDDSFISEYCLCDQWLPQEFKEHNFYYQIKQDNQEDDIVFKQNSLNHDDQMPYLDLLTNSSQNRSAFQKYIKPVESSEEITFGNELQKYIENSDDLVEKRFFFEDESTFAEYIAHHKKCMVKAFHDLIKEEFNTKTPNQIQKIIVAIENKKLPEKYHRKYENIVDNYMNFIKLYFNTKNIYTINDMNNTEITHDVLNMTDIIKHEAVARGLIAYKQTSEDKNYICKKEDCTFSSNKRYNFMVHIKSHLDYVVDFICPYSNCDTHTNQVANLQKHIIKKQKNIHFKCDMCAKSYTEKYNLKKHIQTIH